MRAQRKYISQFKADLSILIYILMLQSLGRGTVGREDEEGKGGGKAGVRWVSGETKCAVGEYLMVEGVKNG